MTGSNNLQLANLFRSLAGAGQQAAAAPRVRTHGRLKGKIADGIAAANPSRWRAGKAELGTSAYCATQCLGTMF